MNYPQVARALITMDPFRWSWGPRPAAPPEGTARLRSRLERLRRISLERYPGRGMGEVAHLLAGADATRPFGIVPDVPRLAGRHPIVLAHGPSLEDLLPHLIDHRDELYVIASLRTAIVIAGRGLWPDVAVLADAAAPAYEVSQRAWSSADPALRSTLEREVTIVVEPLAPAAIHWEFRRACLFDDGLDWLPPESQLPFWGSALLPSLCLPLVLGAPSVAIAGMDLRAAHGRQSRTWAGEVTRRNPAFDVGHGLLESLAMALPDCFVDLTADSIVKRGFSHESLDAYLARPAATTAIPWSGAIARTGAALACMVSAAERFGHTIGAMTSAAARVAELAEHDVSLELSTLVRMMEVDWATDTTYRSALDLIQPPYLRSLWLLREAGFTPRDPSVATRMKARLIGPELAGLQRAYERWLGVVRTAATGVAADGPEG